MKYHPKYGFPLRTYWDTWEGSYQMGIQKHRVYALNLLKREGVESIFEVGAGTGPIWGLIESSNGVWDFEYKGTDYSPAMVAIAKENFPSPNISWEVQDARHLTEKDNSWDCVLLIHTLDHLNDYQSAIKEATRVAKKYVCIVLWRPFVQEGTNLNSINMADRTPEEGPWEDTYLQEYSRETLENEFIKNGLVIEENAEGEMINSDESHYNFLWLLRKQNDKSE
jgi:ubiquinone/menaquinone biosynthesis C-methylase UbiE